MSDEEELTEREKLCRRLAGARRYHRLAVRWLFDVGRLASMYKDNEAWRGGPEYQVANDVTEVANKDHEDAVKEVIQTRELIDRAYIKLKEYDENERHIRESE